MIEVKGSTNQSDVGIDEIYAVRFYHAAQGFCLSLVSSEFNAHQDILPHANTFDTPRSLATGSNVPARVR